MAKDSEDAFYQAKLNDLNNQISEAMKIEENYATTLSSLTEFNIKQNEQLERLNRENDLYDKKLSYYQNSQNPDNKNLDEDNENAYDEDIPEIYKQLKFAIVALNNKLLEPNYDSNFNENVNDIHIPCACRASMIIYVDPNSINLGNSIIVNYQNFRIEKKTTFKDLKINALSLWGIDTKESDDWELRSEVALELKPISRGEEFEVDNYIKLVNLKKAIFFLINKKSPLNLQQEEIKNLLDERKENSKAKTSSIKVIDEVTEVFFQRFVGVTSYMLRKIEKIENEKMNEKKAKNNTKGPNWWSLIGIIASFVFYILFLFFTIYSLQNRISNSQAFVMNSGISQMLNSKSVDSSGSIPPLFYGDTVFDDIKLKLGNIFVDDTGQLSTFMKSYACLSGISFSFHRVANISTPSFVIPSENHRFYYPFYNSSTVDIRSNELANETKLTSFYNSSPGYYYYLNKSNEVTSTYNSTNTTEAIKNLTKFCGEKINKTYQAQINPRKLFSIPGKVGYYDNGYYNLILDPYTVNTNMLDLCLKPLLDYRNSSSSGVSLYDSGLRAMVVTLSLINYQTLYFYYIQIIYEFASYGYVFKPYVNTELFLPNLYASPSSTQALDIIRFIFTLLLFFITFQLFLKNSSAFKDSSGIIFIIMLILQPSVLLNIIIIGLYFTCFVGKLQILNLAMSDATAFLNAAGDNINPLIYSNYSNQYELDVILETTILFILITRLLLFFWEIKAIKVFCLYIFSSFAKISAYFLLIIFLSIGFVIFANNLFGIESDNFIDIASSLYNILLFSIGHFDTRILDNLNQNWNIIFVYLFFIVIVYFILTSFVGIYLESYRIIILRKGRYKMNLDVLINTVDNLNLNPNNENEAKK